MVECHPYKLEAIGSSPILRTSKNIKEGVKAMFILSTRFSSLKFNTYMNAALAELD